MKSGKYFIAYLMLVLFITGCAAGTGPLLKRISRPVIQDVKRAEEVSLPTPPPPTKKFAVGEYYKFQLHWVGIPVGFVTFEIEREEVVSGRKTYVVVIRVNTNKFASKIYKIEDIYTSYVDKERLIPLRYDVNRSEGRYRKNAVTFLDHEKGIAYFENFVDGSKKTYKIPYGVIDPVSSILKARTLEIEVGKTQTQAVTNSESVYKINVNIERRDYIEIKNVGKFDAYFIVPYAILDGKKVKKGKASGYISCDEKRILLYAEAKAPVFTKVTATLVSMKKE